MTEKISSDLIRGHTDTIILGLLAEEDSYGYAVYKEIIDRSDGEYELKETTIYASFRRLEKSGNIASYWGDESQGGRRKYYRITSKGRQQYQTQKSNWEFTKQILDKLL